MLGPHILSGRTEIQIQVLTTGEFSSLSQHYSALPETVGPIPLTLAFPSYLTDKRGSIGHKGRNPTSQAVATQLRVSLFSSSHVPLLKWNCYIAIHIQGMPFLEFKTAAQLFWNIGCWEKMVEELDGQIACLPTNTSYTYQNMEQSLQSNF